MISFLKIRGATCVSTKYVNFGVICCQITVSRIGYIKNIEDLNYTRYIGTFMPYLVSSAFLIVRFKGRD